MCERERERERDVTYLGTYSSTLQLFLDLGPAIKTCFKHQLIIELKKVCLAKKGRV